MSIIQRPVVILVLLCAWAAAQAGVYTWVDEQGVRHFSDQPASEHARRADIRVADSAPSDAATAPDTERIKVLSPQPGAHLTSERGVVKVSVEVAGQLGADEMLAYYLDGQLVAQSPTRMLKFQLAGLPAGPHALQVVLLAAEQEIARTDPIAFTIELAASAKSAALEAG